MKVVHSWLGEYLGPALPTVDEITDLLNFHAFEIDGIEEVEGETVMDIKILPDRSSDCLSHRGIARELASCLGVSLAKDPFQEEVDLKKTDKIKISIAEESACPRFSASLITGVEVKDSPEWLLKRLRALGQRPINNIVDATNYVMYALGQPLHAYDADLFPKVEDNWKFAIRFAKAGEKVSLLPEGGKTEDRVVELDGTELLIVDVSSGIPVGLAGVKGGRYAEINPGTKNIIIEAAHFSPTMTRKTARRLGIVTDASKRFENEPSRELPTFAQQEIIKLITEIAGGTFEGIVDEFLGKSEANPVKISSDRINKLLGLTLPQAEIIKLIVQTGSSVKDNGDGTLMATQPFERTDLTLEVNFAEEVGRIYGLDKITSIKPEARPLSEINKQQYYGDKLRKALIQNGFSEVITSSFQKTGNLQLQNALASDKSYLRESLIKNVTSALDLNYTHTDLLGLLDVRVFEIGTVFHKHDDGVGEHIALCIGVRTKGDGYNKKDDPLLDSSIKIVEEVFGQNLNWSRENGTAELNLTEVLKDLPVPSAYEPVEERSPTYCKTISQYPAISRDIALWVSEGEAVTFVLYAITSDLGPLCVRKTLFDTFTKEGRTSYAFRLVFQAADRTLTDQEVNKIMEDIYTKAKDQGWEVR